MSEETLKEKASKGLFWGGISSGVQQFLVTIIGIVLLKNLTPVDYGMVGMLAIFTGIASMIQESGFTAVLTNRPEFKHEDYNAVFWFNLTTGGVIYIILYISAPLIADFYGKPELVLLSRISFLTLIIGCLGIAQNAVLFRMLMVKERAKIDIFSTTVAGVVGICLALNGFGYWTLVIQALINSLMGTVLRWFFSPWRPTFSITFTPIKEMFGSSSKYLLSTIVNQIQLNIYSVLLGKFYLVSDVGYYSQGSKWAGMGTQLISGMINGIAQPVLTKVKEDRERLVQIFRKMLRFVAFFSFPLLLGIAFISYDFILIINEDWLPCVPILQIYCVGGIISIIQLLYAILVITIGRFNFHFACTFVSAIVQVMVIVLASPYGMYWMACAIVIVSFLLLIVWHFFIKMLLYIDFRCILKDVLPYLCVVIFVFSVTYFVVKNVQIVELRFLLKILIASTIYMCLMWKLNAQTFKDCVAYIKKNEKK